MTDRERIEQLVHASDEEIEMMSYADMIISLKDACYNERGELRSGDFAPRKYWMKTLLTCIDLLKEKSLLQER